MNLLPKIKFCPCCAAVSLIKLNGVTYQNNFESLAEWDLKKIFNCRKCHVKLGLFLSKLNKVKEKNKNNKKKLQDTMEEINNIQNEINLAKIKLKIKYKLQHKGTLLRHVS